MTNNNSGTLGLVLDDLGASADFSGAIDGTSGLQVRGQVSTGTQTLSGANTYTGPTQIDAGRLDVNGSITSNVTVNTNGTLGGTGTITGNVAVGAVGNDGNTWRQIN